MAEPVLVVDPGSSSVAAALVLGDPTAGAEPAVLVRDGRTGAQTWPGVAGVETDPAGFTSLLSTLRAAGSRAIRASYDIDRVTLTVPIVYSSTDRRRDLLIGAGEAAGFREVELVGSVPSALTDARDHFPPIHEGALLLVCDLGDTWSVTLVHVGSHDVDVLGQERSTAGRDLDALLIDDLRTHLGDWVDPALNAAGDVGTRARREVGEFVRRLKHGLVDEPVVSGQLSPTMPPYQLSRDWLARLAEPGLRWLAASARSLLARASTGWGGAAARDATLVDIAAVLLIGGCARLPNATQMLSAALTRPVVVPPEPDFAVLRGAARWAATPRRLVADHPRWRVETVHWQLPGPGVLERWVHGRGEPFRAGDIMAHVRWQERVFELAIPHDGELLSRRQPPGPIGQVFAVTTRRQASALAGDPPDRRGSLTVEGAWLLTPDQVLIECAANARHVRLYSLPDARLVGEFAPDLGVDQQGRVFFDPEGRPSLVVWDRAGTFTVWDVLAGQQVTSFRDSKRPRRVMVNEREWRLTTESEDVAVGGRNRRPVVTVWDLRTGARLERLVDDLERRLAGYQARSLVDGFADRAVSPDGRLQAVAVRSASGAAALALHESDSDHVLFRAESDVVTPPSAESDDAGVRVRAAFTADGRFLLANWESGLDSQVELWEL
jgi:hypothetical protein